MTCKQATQETKNGLLRLTCTKHTSWVGWWRHPPMHAVMASVDWEQHTGETE